MCEEYGLMSYFTSSGFIRSHLMKADIFINKVGGYFLILLILKEWSELIGLN